MKENLIMKKEITISGIIYKRKKNHMPWPIAPVSL